MKRKLAAACFAAITVSHAQELINIEVLQPRVQVAQEIPTDGAPKEAKVAVPLSPEAEAKLSEFATKLAEAKQKLGVARIQKEIQEITKLTGLSATEAKALEPAAEKAAEISAREWTAKVVELFRHQSPGQSEQIIQQLSESLPQVESIAQEEFGFSVESAVPLDQASWKDALQRTLSAEQAALWTKAQEARKRLIEKEIGDFLKRAAEEAREQQRATLLAKSADIKLTLGLPADRAGKLDAIAKSVADRSAEIWKARAERTLVEADDQRRKTYLQRRQFFLPPAEKEIANERLRWEEGLAGLLSPPETDLLKTAQAERRAKRVQILARMMLALLDEKVAFTAAQRDQLQPIAERLVAAQTAFFQQENPEDREDLAPQTFFLAANAAKEAELKPILKGEQWKHWQEATTAKNNGRDEFDPPARPVVSAEDKQQPARKLEPEGLEHSISDFLFARASGETKQALATMLLKAEDIARVTHLEGELTSRLQTAARGAADESLTAWKMNANQYVRTQVVGATPQNIQQRLGNVQEYYFRRTTGPEKLTMWETTVKLVLNEAQLSAWRKETDQRSAYQENAIASTIMAAFDHAHLLTAEQWNKLEPLVVSIVKEYSPDISRMFSSSNQTPWYLQSYSMFLPVAGVPEQELKTILGKEQWERWTASNEFTNATNYWTNVHTNHERMKSVKP